MAQGEQVLTGDSFFHLAGFGEALPGLNLCGAGRVVCLVDPVGDVYACPFAIHDEFLAGNVRSPGGFAGVWRQLGPLPRTPPAHSRVGPAVRAATTTRAGAGAWRPSSSPGCPWTVPIPSASSARVSCRWPNWARPRRPSRRSTIPASAGALRPRPTRAEAVTVAFTPRRPDRACDENPLAELRAQPEQLLSRCPGSSMPLSSPAARAPSRVVFGPHETNLGTGRGHLGPPRRLLRSAGPPAVPASIVTEIGLGPPVGLALRAGPAGRPLRTGLGRGGRRLPPPRNPGAGRARPRRRAGVERLLAVGAVGARPRWPTW